MIKWLYQEEKKHGTGTRANYPKPKDGLIWVYAVRPTEKELEKISKDFRVPPKIIKYYGRERRSVRYSFEPFSCTFVDYHLVEGKPKRTNVLFFISKNFIITILQEPIETYEQVFSELEGRLTKGKLSPVTVLIELLDADIEENYEVLEKIENQLTELEAEIAARKRNANIARVIELRRTLNRMSRAFWGSSRITYFMRTGLTSWEMSIFEARRIDDLHQSLIHQIDIISNHKEVLTDTITIYQTNVSNWLATISNRINASIKLLTWVMFILTGFTLVLTVPNTFATIFGIPYLGLSSEQWPYIIGLLLLATAVPLLWFYLYWRTMKKKAEALESQVS